jgi:hypothetical protein
LLAAVCLVLSVTGIALAPSIFRGLPDDMQRRAAARLPALEAWIATRDPAFETLPTVDPERAAAAAQALLGGVTAPTPTDLPHPSATASVALAVLSPATPTRLPSLAPPEPAAGAVVIILSATPSATPLSPTETATPVPPTETVTPIPPTETAAPTASPTTPVQVAMAVQETPTPRPPDPSPTPAPSATPEPSATAEPTPTDDPTPTPAATPEPTLTPWSTPTPTIAPLPARYVLEGIQRERQGWNNCGPANLVQGLRVLGVEHSQEVVANWLKPNMNDANVSPWQMAAYVHEFTDLRAVIRHNGDLELLRRLVYAGFGVLIETGLYDLEDGSWMGHYQTAVGWDDLAEGGGHLYALDSFMSNGPDGLGRRERYDDIDERWKHFNRLYMVIYPPELESQLAAILGEDWDPRRNIQRALDRALQEAQFNPNDPFAWFNVGTSYVLLEQWPQAAVAYDRARSAGDGLPWRMLWYQFGPYQAYFQVGEYRTVVDLANAVINQTPYIEESFYYRGLAYLALGVPEQGRNDLQQAARFNRNFAPARTALTRLSESQPPLPETL